MTNLITLGVSGDIGSFSHEAGILYAKNVKINPVLNYLIDMQGVLAAIENKTINIGIFPVVNLKGGLVRAAFDAMGDHNFKVIDELWLNVNQCLLTRADTSIDKIKYIVSHSQALNQCMHYLQKNFPAAKLIQWQDTAAAAKELSRGNLPELSAVLAPEQAAYIYGLHIAAKNVQDVNPNLTAFIIVKNHGAL